VRSNARLLKPKVRTRNSGSMSRRVIIWLYLPHVPRPSSRLLR
jgi:hypothetical protein